MQNQFQHFIQNFTLHRQIRPSSGRPPSNITDSVNCKSSETQFPYSALSTYSSYYFSLPPSLPTNDALSPNPFNSSTLLLDFPTLKSLFDEQLSPNSVEDLVFTNDSLVFQKLGKVIKCLCLVVWESCGVFVHKNQSPREAGEKGADVAPRLPKEWTRIIEVLPQQYQTALNTFLTFGNGCKALLYITAVIDRFLGDVIYTYSNRTNDAVPFLMKDLLTVLPLEYFRLESAFLLRILVGPSTSFNIRNIAWHGFLDPMEFDEIGMKFAALLAVIFVSLVNMLNEKGFDFVTMRSKGCRSCVDLRRDETPGGSKNENEKVLMKLLEILLPKLQETFRDYFSSSYIHLPNSLSQCRFQPSLPSLSDYLSSDLAAYLSSPTPQNQLSFLLTTIPYLETYLRLIYVVVNDISGEKWRTRHQGFFVLLEDIMQRWIADDDEKKEDDTLGGKTCRKRNKIVEVIGSGAANLLYDLFLHQAGPRLRDRLSHGEFSLLYTPTIIGDTHQSNIKRSTHPSDAIRFTTSFSRDIVYLIIYLHTIFNFNTSFVTMHNANRIPPDPQLSLAPSVEAGIEMSSGMHSSISQIFGNDMQYLASTICKYMLTYKSKYHPLSLLYRAVCKTDDMLKNLKKIIDTQNDTAAISNTWYQQIEWKSLINSILGSLSKLIDRHEVMDKEMKDLRYLEPGNTLYRDDSFIKVINLWIAIINGLNGTVEMVW